MSTDSKITKEALQSVNEEADEAILAAMTKTAIHANLEGVKGNQIVPMTEVVD